MNADFHERLDRVETLVEAIERCPDPAAREASRLLVRTMLDLHAAGLARVLELAAGQDSLTDRLTGDELISGLLLLHGLHPHPAKQRMLRALDRARHRLRSLGGDVELIDATDHLVRLQLRGEPTPPFRKAVEELATEVVPDASLEIEEVGDPALGGRVSLPLMARVGGRP